MRYVSISVLFLALPGLALAADKDITEPAIIILLLLGLAAVIGGLGSIGELRRKHMLPPRPRDAHKPPPDKESPHPHS